MRSAIALAFVAVPALGLAQTLSTAPPNNGSGGIFLNLTPSSQSLFFTAFQTYFSGAVGLSVNVQVYTRPGTYVGFTASSAGWLLSETVGGTAAGTTTLSTPLVLSNPILLNAGQTTGVYLHSITATGGIRYTGTAASPPQTTWSNADLALFSDTSRTGTVAFAGTQFSPRTFAGTIHYAPVPEPATIGALGIGTLALVGRRRRSRAA